MELLGAIEGLSSVLETEELIDKQVILISDSRYVIDGLKSWLAGWKKRGWKKSDGKPPENLDLWMRLDKLNQELNGVHLYWVKRHSGHPQNELCDQLANEALDEAGL
jgi:ribonuclease HI